MSKKLHAKEMKKDEFVDTLGELWGPVFHWLQLHRKTLGWTLGIILGALILFGAIGSFRQSSVNGAQAALGEAIDKLEEAETAAARKDGPAPAWNEVRQAFEKVADERGGTPGQLARHYVGVLQLREGDAAGAVATLSEAAAGRFDPWRTPISLSVLAAAQEEAGDPAAAEATWKRLRTEDALGFPADAAAMELARFYERQGRLEDARALYSELAAEGEGEERAGDEVEAEDANEADGAEAPKRSIYAGAAQARLDELQG